MALERKTLVDQVEIRRDGTIQVRLLKAIVDGDTIVASEYHRLSLEPGAQLEVAAKVVNDSLATMGAAVVSAEEWARVARVVDVEHTAEVNLAFAARQKQIAPGARGAGDQTAGFMA